MQKVSTSAKFQLTKTVITRFSRPTTAGAARPLSSSIISTVSSVI